MSKSKIILALLTGVAVGAVVAYTVKTMVEDKSDHSLEDAATEPSKFDGIAQQFSDKISLEMKAAERKIRSAVQKEIDALSPEKELGLFL